MEEISVRAFVGHSFKDRDKKIVNTFTEYFESLKIGRSFDWDHAKRSETKAISVKINCVLSLKYNPSKTSIKYLYMNYLKKIYKAKHISTELYESAFFKSEKRENSNSK